MTVPRGLVRPYRHNRAGLESNWESNWESHWGAGTRCAATVGDDVHRPTRSVKQSPLNSGSKRTCNSHNARLCASPV